MTGRRTSAMLRIGLVSVGLAATAMTGAQAADARQTCRDITDSYGTHTGSLCQTNGSVSIAANPGTTAPPAGRIPWEIVDGN